MPALRGLVREPRRFVITPRRLDKFMTPPRGQVREPRRLIITPRRLDKFFTAPRG